MLLRFERFYRAGLGDHRVDIILDRRGYARGETLDADRVDLRPLIEQFLFQQNLEGLGHRIARRGVIVGPVLFRYSLRLPDHIGIENGTRSDHGDHLVGNILLLSESGYGECQCGEEYGCFSYHIKSVQ